jgi:hypothetical protein
MERQKSNAQKRRGAKRGKRQGRPSSNKKKPSSPGKGGPNAQERLQDDLKHGRLQMSQEWQKQIYDRLCGQDHSAPLLTDHDTWTLTKEIRTGTNERGGGDDNVMKVVRKSSAKRTVRFLDPNTGVVHDTLLRAISEGEGSSSSSNGPPQPEPSDSELSDSDSDSTMTHVYRSAALGKTFQYRNKSSAFEPVLPAVQTDIDIVETDAAVGSDYVDYMAEPELQRVQEPDPGTKHMLESYLDEIVGARARTQPSVQTPEPDESELIDLANAGRDVRVAAGLLVFAGHHPAFFPVDPVDGERDPGGRAAPVQDRAQLCEHRRAEGRVFVLAASVRKRQQPGVRGAGEVQQDGRRPAAANGNADGAGGQGEARQDERQDRVGRWVVL